MCVLGLGSRLRLATPGCGFRLCVCLCARSSCTPPLLVGVCGVGVCAWARVFAAPRLSWLEFWRVCVFVYALCLYAATPGWGVRCRCVFCARVSAARRHLRLGCLGVFAPLAARRSWLGCAVWVGMLRLGFRLRAATPGWGVGVCVCVCVRCACNPQLPAGLCCVGVCAWARVSAAPRHSWPGCLGVCVFVWALCLYHATPGWAVWCECVCLASAFGCAPPPLAGVLGCVCV